MPKIAYSQEDRERIRSELLETGLNLMAKQGVRHTTVEQIYRKVGISRTFFYTFFPAKEDLIVEALYLQQPKVVRYAKKLMSDPDLSWREGVRRFLYSCCYGEENGIAVLSVEEQQLIFKRLSEDSCKIFRERQRRLFGRILECFGIRGDNRTIGLFTNLSLLAMIIPRAIPDTLPLFVPEAAKETVEFQIDAMIDALEHLKIENKEER